MGRSIWMRMTNEHRPEFGDDIVPIADLHAVLRSEERRRVLQFFQERDECVATLDELANHLAARDGGFEGSERARVALHHAHLPKLAEMGVLDYDARTHMTRYRGHARLEALLPEASVA